MAKICIISSQHLSRNPRVWKEAISLTTLGHNVIILTVWTSAEHLSRDYELIANHKIEYIGVIDLVSNKKNVAKKVLLKIRRRFALVMKRYINIDSVWMLGVSPNKFFSAALQVNAELYIAHVEFGFYVGELLIKAGKKVGFDFEDWYSKDYLIRERPVKLLQKLEYAALKYGIYCTCPSQSMAEALRSNYKVEKEIVVIYNGFSVEENRTIINNYHNSNPTLIWFSQTIGNGRGLETLIESLELLDIPVTLNLVGDCSFEYGTKLKAIFPFHKNHQLVIHPVVPHRELLFLLTQHNIGLALENSYPANKNKTVSNKILQYIQAGIKILATNTHGQIEVAAHLPETVKIVSVNKPKEWAENLKYLINSPKVNKQEQLEIFTKHFSWEAQEKKLATLVKSILHN